MSEIPHHNSVERAPGDRGAGLGLARARAGQADRGDLPAAVLRARPSSTSRRCAHWGERRWSGSRVAPELGEEIQGIAAGSGVDAELIGALNARTEVLAAGRGECSTVACLGNLTASGQPIGMQTWDWHDALAGSWLRWTIDHADGRRVDTLTEAGIVGKIGVSNSGVGVFLNILGHAADGPPIGTPVHVHVPDGARPRRTTPSEALAILAGAQVSASSAVTSSPTDEDGGACCTVELSPAGPGFVTPDDRGVLAHTNHFLAEPGRLDDTMVRLGPDSVLRLDHARRGMARLTEGTIDEDSILGVMRQPSRRQRRDLLPPAPDAPFGDRWQTLATITVAPLAPGDGPCAAGGPLSVVEHGRGRARQSLSRQGSAAS